MSLSTYIMVCNLLFLSDELGYLVDAIVNEDKIDSFDSRPNNMSLEVNAINTSTNKYLIVT